MVTAALLPWLLSLHGDFVRERSRAGIEGTQALVESLSLTDPVLSTEARYLRHRGLADRFAPFQDQPGLIDLYPSGGVYRPLAPMFESWGPSPPTSWNEAPR